MASFNNFDKVAQGLYDALADVVVQTASDIEEQAAANAPVLTGFLQSSVYSVSEQGSSYGKIGAPTHEGSYVLPEIPQPEDRFTAYVGVGANYAVFQEFGTVHTRAQPYLVPAVDAAESSFESAVSAIESKLRGI